MKAVVALADGFEEIEFSTIVDILRRAGVEVTTASLKQGYVEGAHGVRVMPDSSIDNVLAGDFDVVVLPGGYPGFVNLGQEQRVLDLVKEMDKGGKYIAAICGAPSVLSKIGVVEGKKATINPGCKDMLVGAQYVDQRVVVDGRVITSQAPGTAMDFAMRLVEVLLGRDKMEELKARVLAKL
jgi:4-methyl-5(b-hydroxyethyl)-thiazole monophosphate biosynthesis